MISAQDALQRLAEVRPALEAETVPVALALGRTLAAPVHAALDVPAFARSAMDGYALRAQDAQNVPRALLVTGAVAAGSVPRKLEPGTALRIFTGAPLPEGADSVIEQEAVSRHEHQVFLTAPVAPGRNVVRRGHQFVRGDAVFLPGERLTAQHVGILASLGLTHVAVWRTLRVGILQTGPELQRAGHPLAPGQIYEVQAVWWPAWIREWGGRVTRVQRVGDDLEEICHSFETLADDADVVLSSGGISVGDFDFVHQALTRVADPLFWRVAMHPGRSVGAARRGRTLLLALSGNPGAAHTSWMVLLAPWWAGVQGGRLADRRGFAPLATAYPKSSRDTRFLHVTETPEGLVWERQENDTLIDRWSSAFAVIPAGSGPLPRGTLMPLWAPSGSGGRSPHWTGSNEAWPFLPPPGFSSACESDTE